MSRAVDHPDSYALPAGLLALAVHAVFFGLLYFGFNWHTEAPQGMVVDLWSSLPQAGKMSSTVVHPPKPVAPPKHVEPPKPVEEPKPAARPKPAIALPEKKPPKEKPKEKPKPEKKPVPSKQEAKKIAAEAAQQAQAEREAQAAQAAAAAAITNEVGKYKGLISAKIRLNIVPVPGVADDAQAEFDVTLLPDGEVLDATLTKSSGSDAYDQDVARAILKAQPLPLPPEQSLKQLFRKLHLKFSPKDQRN